LALGVVHHGWMNRLVGMLPRRGKDAIAFSPAVPMALRGLSAGRVAHRQPPRSSTFSRWAWN
jgi:hypothetical protein